MENEDKLIKSLALKALKMSGNSPQEIERYCWMVIHEYCNGVMPVEYDIRDIDETLYINVLSYAKKKF